VTLTQAVAATRSFFCFGLLPLALLPLDYQWIYASSKLVNQVNCLWEDWRDLETHSLRVVSVPIRLIKSWSDYLALSKFQQFDFIEKINTLDMPPNDIRSVLFDRSKSASYNRFAPGEAG
jgi:hypothetical protein